MLSNKASLKNAFDTYETLSQLLQLGISDFHYYSIFQYHQVYKCKEMLSTTVSYSTDLLPTPQLIKHLLNLQTPVLLHGVKRFLRRSNKGRGTDLIQALDDVLECRPCMRFLIPAVCTQTERKMHEVYTITILNLQSHPKTPCNVFFSVQQNTKVHLDSAYTLLSIIQELSSQENHSFEKYGWVAVFRRGLKSKRLYMYDSSLPQLI